VPADVVKGKGKRRQQGGDDADGIRPESARSDHADHKCATSYRQPYSRDAVTRRLLESTRYHVEQHPHRRRILQDDCSSNIRLLNREVVEVIRGGDAEHSEQKTFPEVRRRQLQIPPAAPRAENRQQH